jgi:hypothetical protein
VIPDLRSPAHLEAGQGAPWLAARDLAFLEKWQAELKSRFAGLW